MITRADDTTTTTETAPASPTFLEKTKALMGIFISKKPVAKVEGPTPADDDKPAPESPNMLVKAKTLLLRISEKLTSNDKPHESVSAPAVLESEESESDSFLKDFEAEKGIYADAARFEDELETVYIETRQIVSAPAVMTTAEPGLTDDSLSPEALELDETELSTEEIAKPTNPEGWQALLLRTNLEFYQSTHCFFVAETTVIAEAVISALPAVSASTASAPITKAMPAAITGVADDGFDIVFPADKPSGCIIF